MMLGLKTVLSGKTLADISDGVIWNETALAVTLQGSHANVY